MKPALHFFTCKWAIDEKGTECGVEIRIEYLGGTGTPRERDGTNHWTKCLGAKRKRELALEALKKRAAERPESLPGGLQAMTGDAPLVLPPEPPTTTRQLTLGGLGSPTTNGAALHAYHDRRRRQR